MYNCSMKRTTKRTTKKAGPEYWLKNFSGLTDQDGFPDWQVELSAPPRRGQLLASRGALFQVIQLRRFVDGTGFEIWAQSVGLWDQGWAADGFACAMPIGKPSPWSPIGFLEGVPIIIPTSLLAKNALN
jgi:hypothetical protein